MLTPAAGDRLRKLVLLLSSDKDGEALAARDAIGRTLEAEGATWHDLANLIAGPAQPEPDPLERVLAELDERATHAHDRKWLVRLGRYYARHGRLSARQMEVLGDIAGRCCHA